MKKVLTVILVILCVGGIFAYRWKTQNDIKKIVYSACDDFVANYDYSNTRGFTIDSIDYKINKVKKSNRNTYLIDITWYIDYSATTYKKSFCNEKLFDIVENILIYRNFHYKNCSIFFTHTKKTYNDSVRVVANGGYAFSGKKQSAIREMKSGNGKDYHGHDKYDAMEVAKAVVKEHLKSPSTAKFCSTTNASFSCDGYSWTVSGWVDAQNSFGAIIRNSFTVKFTCTDDYKYTVDYYQITDK